MNIFFKELKLTFLKVIYSDKQKTILVKWKQSLLAIMFALLLTFFLILLKGQNPFLIFIGIIEGATRNAESLNQMWLYYAMFMLAGLSIIIGFKTGLFNIGIGGQMLISGATMMILAIKTSLPWIILAILGMLVAAISASISGVLKALFNIHEVVSTILINWIFFYISQYLLNPGMNWVDDFGTTKEIADGSRMKIGDSIVMPALLLTSVLLIGAIVLFKFTKYGYALKAVGQNIHASKYAGIKVALQLALGMALSGVAAGALASVNYLGKFGSMSQAPGQHLPAIGFQGISVALISFNSLFGLIPAAFFWAIITSGADYVSIIYPEVPKEVLSLMNGFIIYMIAISIVFIRFRPIKTLQLFYLKMKSPEIISQRAKVKKARWAQKTLFTNRKNEIKTLNQVAKIQTQLNNLKVKKQEILKVIKAHEKTFNKNIKKPFFIKPHFANSWNIKKWIINNNYQEEIAKYENKKYDYIANDYEKHDEIILKINNLRLTLEKNLIAKNKQNYKNGLSIINDEYKRRLNIVQNNYISKSRFGKWKIKHQLNQKRIMFFTEKYNLIKLAFKENIKNVKDKEMKLKLKNNFSLNVKQLEKEINNLEIPKGKT